MSVVQDFFHSPSVIAPPPKEYVNDARYVLRVRGVNGVATNVVNNEPISVGDGVICSITDSMIKSNTEDYNAMQLTAPNSGAPETWIPLPTPITSGEDITISCFLPSNPFYNYYGAGRGSTIGLLYLYSSDTYATWFIMGTYYYDLSTKLFTMQNSTGNDSYIWCTRNGGGGYGLAGIRTKAVYQTPNHFVLTRINGNWYCFWNGIHITEVNSLTAGGGTNFTHLVLCPSRQSHLVSETFEDLCVIRGSLWKSNFTKPTDYLPDDLSEYLG